MGAPNSTITITLEALTEQANAKINSFFSGLVAKAKAAFAAATPPDTFFVQPTGKLKKMLDDIAAGANNAGTRMAGMSYYFRSAMDSVRFALAGGGARAGFYALDEAVRGVISSGGEARETLISVAAELAEMVPLVGTVVLGWSALNGILSKPPPLSQYLTKQNDQLKEQADWLRIVQKLQQSGAITGQQASRDSDFNIGSISDLMQRGLVMGSKDGAKLTETGQAFVAIASILDQVNKEGLDETGKKLDEIDTKFQAFKNVMAAAGATLVASGKMTQAAYDALIRSIDAAHEKASNAAVADANSKNFEENQKKAQEAYAKGQQMFAEMVRKENEDLDRQLSLSAAQQGKTREQIYQEEYKERMRLLMQQLFEGIISEDDYTKAVTDAQIKRLQGYKAEQDEIRRLSDLKEQASQKDYDFQKRKIDQNPFLTTDQKNQQLSGLVASQIGDVSGKLAQNLAAKPSSTEDQIRQLEQRRELQQQLNGLLLEQSKLLDQAGFINHLKSAWTSYYDQVANTSKDLANFMVSPFKGLSDGIASSLQTIIEKGGSLKTFFVGIGQSIEQAMIQSFSELVADFITKEAMMLAAHVAGESAQTGATAAGGAARGALRLGETIYHGLLVALRTGAHILGEIAMTAVTIAETLIRRAAAFLEAQPYIFLAAVKAASSVADIPYVGPILAPIAAATTFAALEAMAVFRKGGFTGDGSPDEVAGLVHRGEFVIPADRVRQYGLGFFQSLHSGQFAAASAGSLSVRGDTQPGPGGSVIQHKTELSLATFGGEADAKRWAEGQDGETWFLDMMSKHAYKYQRG